MSDEQTIEDLLDTLREVIPPKKTGAEQGKRKNRAVPCWRTNRTTELKALKTAFKRNGADTIEKKMALVNDMIASFQEITRHRAVALGAQEFVSQPRMLTTWLSQDGFSDEFETPTSELKKRETQFECHIEGCRNEDLVRHDATRMVCRPHYLKLHPDIEELRGIVRGHLARTPREPDETWRAWSMRVLAEYPVGRAYLKRIRV